jgi:hypothetical protein
MANRESQDNLKPKGVHPMSAIINSIIARKNGQPSVHVETGAREGGTTGHQAAEGSGLRGHSCGDTFPFGYVTLGDGTHVLTRHGAPIIGPNHTVSVRPQEAIEAGLPGKGSHVFTRLMAAQYRKTGLYPFERTGTWAEALAAL